MKKKAIICDLDETLISNPIYYEDFKEFHNHILEGEPNEWCVTLVKALHQVGIEIIFLTARSECCRHHTQLQLNKLFDFNYTLLMRKNDDISDSFEMKEIYLLELMQEYEILFVLDDDYTNCEMFSNYLPTLKVERC